MPALDPRELHGQNASSSPHTLQIMTWVAVAHPVVLLYRAGRTAFRKRISAEQIPEGVGLSLRKIADRWGGKPRRPRREAR